jgi:hypothetical protein
VIHPFCLGYYVYAASVVPWVNYRDQVVTGSKRICDIVAVAIPNINLLMDKSLRYPYIKSEWINIIVRIATNVRVKIWTAQ